FALAAMVAWSAYGRAALEEFCPGGGGWFGLLFAAAAAAGVLLPVGRVLALCDLAQLCMVLPNARALFRLTKTGKTADRKNFLAKL
ncbi:MAG: hypothetical protein IKU17_01245, partial [Clostridia bacterium]|nr:hypothetical protein [Clostridia bacterium]